MTSPLFHLCLLAGICISSAFAHEEKPASTPPKSESSKTQFQRTQTPQPSPEMQTLLSALSGTDEFKRNGKKYTFKEIVFDITANTYTQALYQGESGSELRRLLTIRATKVPAVTAPVSKPAQQLPTLNMPGPKVQNLMLGTWSIKIKDEPSKEMPQGGTGEGTQVWRPGPGGRSIIEEEHWRNPPGEFDGFSVGWWDAKAEG